MTAQRRPLVIRNEYHALGEETGVERHSLRQALAWQIAAELARRHPGDIFISETHPGGGQYDCVTIGARAHGEEIEWEGGWRTIAQMNKATARDHITHQGWFDQTDADRFNWLEVLLSPDLRTQVVEPLERAEGLNSPSKTPPTVAGSIGVRLLAAFASRVAFTRKPWVLLNGYLDTSGYGAGVRDELFDAIPTLSEDRRVRRDDDLLATPEYRYWFVVEGDPISYGRAHLAMDTRQGIAYTATASVDLLDRYRALGRRIDGLASEVCPPAY